jgi:hypothetical protein
MTYLRHRSSSAAHFHRSKIAGAKGQALAIPSHRRVMILTPRLGGTLPAVVFYREQRQDYR